MGGLLTPCEHYIRTYVHTYIRTQVHTYIRTYVHAYIYICIYIHVSKYNIFGYVLYKFLGHIKAYLMAAAQEARAKVPALHRGGHVGTGIFMGKMMILHSRS